MDRAKLSDLEGPLKDVGIHVAPHDQEKVLPRCVVSAMHRYAYFGSVRALSV